MGVLILWGDQLKMIDLEAFSLFGYQASAALETVSLVEKVKQMANTDELTGILNRRGINGYGRHDVEVAARLNQPLSAILLDLDHLKKINDSFGHSVGDEVIREVVKKCKDNIREIDLLGRYGGDEFLLLLIGSTIDQAAVIAERLRKLVEQDAVQTEAGNLNMTSSLGVTATPPAPGLIDKLIATADAALYQAKNNGRNQVAIWKESGILP
jgi:diguanylate cyclase (GGDEF)-like protein